MAKNVSKTRQNDNYGGSRLTDVAPDFEAFTAHGMLKFPLRTSVNDLWRCGREVAR